MLLAVRKSDTMCVAFSLRGSREYRKDNSATDEHGLPRIEKYDDLYSSVASFSFWS
jgi:hypothetical protein